MAVRAFLDLPNGMAVRIDAAGLLVGRHNSCDIQLADAAASRRHALLRLAPAGVELVVLGRQAVTVARAAGTELAVAASEPLAAGDRVQFPGLAGTLRVEQAIDTVRVDYCIRHAGQRFPITTTPFVVGDSPDAKIALAAIFPLRFTLAQGVLYVEIGDAEPRALAVGDTVDHVDQQFAIEAASTGDATTLVAADVTLARAITLAPLPRGGRVTFAFPDGDRTVYLPGRRFALISALAAPPAPLALGDFVPDSELVPVVWADDDTVGGRAEINVLLTRCRQDLVAAGISATSLLERAPGGRATRMRTAPGARVHRSEAV